MSLSGLNIYGGMGPLGVGRGGGGSWWLAGTWTSVGDVTRSVA